MTINNSLEKVLFAISKVFRIISAKNGFFCSDCTL